MGDIRAPKMCKSFIIEIRYKGSTESALVNSVVVMCVHSGYIVIQLWRAYVWVVKSSIRCFVWVLLIRTQVHITRRSDPQTQFSFMVSNTCSIQSDILYVLQVSQITHQIRPFRYSQTWEAKKERVVSDVREILFVSEEPSASGTQRGVTVPLWRVRLQDRWHYAL